MMAYRQVNRLMTMAKPLSVMLVWALLAAIGLWVAIPTNNSIVQACHLVYIEISPDDASITAGDSQTYTAEAFDENGASMGDVTADTVFSIDAEAGGSWLANTYTSEHAGTWIVTGTYNDKSDSATIDINTGSLYRFIFHNIASPQIVSEVFPITITAIDECGNIVTGFTGTAHLTDLSGSMSPITSGSFVAGVWTGDINITSSYDSNTVTAADGIGDIIAGTSNPFDTVTFLNPWLIAGLIAAFILLMLLGWVLWYLRRRKVI